MSDGLKTVTPAEMIEELLAHREKMDAIFNNDVEQDYLTINASYPYHIALGHIPDPEALLRWVHHLTGKRWMTSALVREFIERVYSIKGWDTSPLTTEDPHATD